ncbi:hypothetical protein BDZ94DRAFT_1306284 [Collybia nuda]|uniref:Uncharacterized protein n=1 Tax=Collybia nuda TaxID=64659 RepID=A0A9P5YCE4_9AGAR|nr:hypothetical protein BDZ94DRAFT_1306284 [Collybia nuda]
MVYLTILVSLITAVQAVNDWSQPCLSGVCSYDLPASAGSSSGTLKIWGPKDAISDITTAAGWEILGCSPDTLEQDIRLVCASDDSSTTGCAHLYENSGAEGKIVRLPEACGKNAFARVAKAWVPADQSIPPGLERRLARRGQMQPQVKALRLDTKFAAVNPSKAGIVNFAIKGATIPGANGEIDTSTIGPHRGSRIYGNRGVFDFVGDAIDAISGLNDFNIDESKVLDPIDFDKKFNLLNQEISCPPLAASLNIDVDTKAHALATIGVAASGTIVPPKVDDFALISSLTADINGSVDLAGTVSGTLDSGKIKIFEVGIPGLDFPGCVSSSFVWLLFKLIFLLRALHRVLTVGPTFEVNAQAVASLDLDVGLTVGLNYKIDKAELIFPPNSKKAKAAGGTFKVGDTPLKLSVSPSVKAIGTVEAHLIPSLNLKLSALGDIVNAGIFLELDTSADMKLSLEAQAQGTLNLPRASVPTIQGRNHLTGAAPTTLLAVPMESLMQPVQQTSSSAKGPMVHASAVTNDQEHQNSTAKISTMPLKSTSTGMETGKHAMPTTSGRANDMNPTSTARMGGTTMMVDTSRSMMKTGSVSATNSATPPQVTTDGKGSAAPTKDINGSFGGCIEIGAGLDVNAGADADFFGLFDPSTKVNLFTKKFQIFKKCFGNNARRSFPRFPRLLRSAPLRARELACPAADIGAATPIIDELIKAASIATL